MYPVFHGRQEGHGRHQGHYHANPVGPPKKQIASNADSNHLRKVRQNYRELSNKPSKVTTPSGLLLLEFSGLHFGQGLLGIISQSDAQDLNVNGQNR